MAYEVTISLGDEPKPKWTPKEIHPIVDCRPYKGNTDGYSAGRVISAEAAGYSLRAMQRELDSGACKMLMHDDAVGWMEAFKQLQKAVERYTEPAPFTSE